MPWTRKIKCPTWIDDKQSITKTNPGNIIIHKNDGTRKQEEKPGFVFLTQIFVIHWKIKDYCGFLSGSYKGGFHWRTRILSTWI